MDNSQFGRALEKRTKDFAVRMIQLSAKLPNTPEGRVIRGQLTGAGTSIGANYRETNRSRSRADFRNKIAICESETSETQYWMELVVATEWLTEKQIAFEYKECGELLAIFTSIGKKLK